MSGTNYVLGFLFSEEGEVALIRKARPAWQAGKWNGVGGKIEADEAPTDAMSREYEEETWQKVTNWQKVARLIDVRGYVVHVFAAMGSPTSTEKVNVDAGNYVHVEEMMEVFDMSRLPSLVLPNVKWLVPMAWSVLIGAETRAATFDIMERP